MADKHPFFSVIAISTAFSLGVFVALQYVQVIPLEREVAKLKEQLRNQDKKVKISLEYQELNNLYAQKKARSELLEEELKKKSGIESELVKTQLKLESALQIALELKENGNYKQAALELKQTRRNLEQYKEAYENTIEENKSLTKAFSIKKEVGSLVEKRTEIERTIDCMLHGCRWVHLQKYDKNYEQTAYIQYDSQLKSINKQIEVLYAKLK